MKHRNFEVETDGFHGVYYPCEEKTDRAMILMMGDSSDDYMAKSAAKWIRKYHIDALMMSPSKKDYGHHNYPVERIESASEFLKKDHTKIGIGGASTTAMVSLVSASLIPDITLTLAFSPSDFVMEGFYQDGKDGAHERPGDNESTLSYRGKPLPYLPYAYRHPEYWKKLSEEAKEGGDKVASRKMFDESERRHPLKEEELIKVENIKGKIVFVGAEDDVLWDTCRYIKRMMKRLEEKGSDVEREALLYPYGTHFIFPESLGKMMLPVGFLMLVKFIFASARKHPKECQKTWKDIDENLDRILKQW
ncbi:MAG: acyl-CoA thioester hydrolase [Erysipelotrichaceae bacterium]|nr:acyl-CoA thioester hydrolase [Erysipelotrichaceae bacterium]